jgi:hypothetical protein
MTCLTWFRVIPYFNVVRHAVIVLSPFYPVGAIAVKVIIKKHVAQPETRESHRDVCGFYEHVEYNTYPHFQYGVNFVIEIVFDDRVSVDFAPQCRFQTDNVSVDNTEYKVREVLEESQACDEEGHPLELQIECLLHGLTFWIRI